MSEVPSSPLLEALYQVRSSQQASEEAEALPHSFRAFLEAAWKEIEPDTPFMPNWHIDAIAEHLQAASNGETNRLQIWIPRQSGKSKLVSVLWPAWEWTREPRLKIFSVSYDLALAGRNATESRDLMMRPWYQQRWGDKFNFVREGERYFDNDRGGYRISTSAPEGQALGYHGHRILIDDAINAHKAERDSDIIEDTNRWYDRSIPGTRQEPCVEVIIMQRLSERDIAAHALDVAERSGVEWTILCLPERYEHDHPQVWPGDPRKEGDLLWPARRNEQQSNEMAASLLAFRAAGQMQQRPASREGEILKRDWWRFYDDRIRDKEEWSHLPRFGMVVISVDTPLKDKQSSDNVACQCWGISGADRYLLDMRLGKMNYGLAKRTVREMALWARKRWRGCRHQILIENAGYGVELITDLKRELTGVIKISPGQDGSKVMRAEAASDGLESGNYFLPGFGPPWQPAYDEHKTPSDVADFIHNAAVFPNATHDDDVDAWSQLGNWLRDKQTQPIRTSQPRRRLPVPLR